MINKLLRKLRKSARQRRGAKQIRRTGFWFIDIPRTSSSSIKAELGQRFGPAYGKMNLIEREYASEQWFEDHIPAEQMRYIIGDKSWDDLYTFTFVRNPFDRVQSLYHYLQKRNEIPQEWCFSEFVRRLVDAEEKTPYFGFHGLRYSAADFILDKNGTVLVDDIFRYEDRSGGIRQISEKIGFPELGRLSIQSASPSGQSYRAMYDDATRDLVSQRFAKDIKLFDYSF